MIDLHTHTTNSDGTWKAEELIAKAQAENIEVLSITDHQSVKAYFDLENIDCSQIYKGKLIPGVELNTIFEGVRIEVLVYDFEINKMKKFIDEQYILNINEENYIREYKELEEMCKKQNIQIDSINYRFSDGYPVLAIYKNIKKYSENKKFFSDEVWQDSNCFFRNCTTNKSFILYLDFPNKVPFLEDIIKDLKSCSGKIFVAHLYEYKIEDEISFLKKLKDLNLIDGIEVYYSTHTKKETERLEQFCIDNNLLMSGGSDCHGDRKKDRRIGIGYGGLNIPKEIMNNWNVENWYI